MRLLLKLSLLLVLCSVAFADVAPDPGYTNVPADLILRPYGDLSAYRFFLESPTDVEEVELIATPVVIAAQDRGGARRYARLIAIPRDDFNTISGDLSDALLADLIRRKSFSNATELLSHNFQATIPLIEKPLWRPPSYFVSAHNGVVTAEKPIDGLDRSTVARLLFFGGIGGVLFAIGIAIIGIWLFRRSRKKV
jgi:hypothetical protein